MLDDVTSSDSFVRLGGTFYTSVERDISTPALSRLLKPLISMNGRLERGVWTMMVCANVPTSLEYSKEVLKRVAAFLQLADTGW